MELVKAFVFWVACSSAIAGTVSLSWTTPTARENGEQLPANEISGYEIYVVCGNFEKIVQVGTVNTHIINHLSGDCFFSISTIDMNGLKSGLSNPVNKAIAPDAPMNFKLRNK